MRMTDAQAVDMFASKSVGPIADGKAPVCPHCGCLHLLRSAPPVNGSLRYPLQGVPQGLHPDQSGTLFAFHKMPLRQYLAAIVIFCNEVKGKSALALSRDLGCQYKTSFRPGPQTARGHVHRNPRHHIAGWRLARSWKSTAPISADIVKPANKRENRRGSPPCSSHQNGKRQCVVVIRERDGKVLPAAFRSEHDALTFIRNRVARETEIMVDESSAWNDLSARYVVKTINHQIAYSLDGACTNGAESFFSRMRRAEQGHHHHIAGVYLGRYAQESAWREDARRVTNGGQVRGVVGLALAAKPSVDFCGYWQRAAA